MVLTRLRQAVPEENQEIGPEGHNQEPDLNASEPGIEIKPIAGCIGAEVHGIDLTREIRAVQFDRIQQAFLEHLVIFLPQHKVLTPAHLTTFARHFGALDDDPFVFPFKIPSIEGYPEIYSNIKTAENTEINIGGYWHTNVSQLPLG